MNVLGVNDLLHATTDFDVICTIFADGTGKACRQKYDSIVHLALLVQAIVTSRSMQSKSCPALLLASSRAFWWPRKGS